MIENPLTKAIAEALMKMEELKYITYNPILNKEVVISAIEAEIEKISWKDFIHYVLRRCPPQKANAATRLWKSEDTLFTVLPVIDS